VGDQRYCLDCGARRDASLPPAVAALIATFLDRDRGKEAAAAVVPAAKAAAAADSAHPADAAAAAGERKGLLAWIPSPRAAGAAVICMLGLGVVIGSATSQIAQSAGLQTIVLEIAEKKAPPPAEEPLETAAAPEEAVAEASAPEVAAELPLPEALPEEVVEEPLPEELPEEEPLVPFDPEEEVEETLPEVKHLFVIMLGENGYEETFGASSPAPYLQKTLPEQGELLPNYYGVAQGKLANQVALLSGQGPTEELVAECPAPTPTEIVPGSVRADTATTTEQVEGNGCLFPAPVETLPDQLAAKELKWKAYVEEAVPGTPEPPSCAKPFGLFHSLLDQPQCAESVAGLPQLAKDLKDPKTAPAFSYIVPNRCHAGAVEPCEPGQPTGPVAAEPFLQEVVPQIVSSKAYADGGLLLITSAQAPQTGAATDTSSCCANPAYPNLPPLPEEVPGEGGVKKTGGGGKVGLLLLSSFVKPGSIDETTTANHLTLLSTIEELFELEKLGYAKEPALLPLEPSVFNAGAEEESTSVTEEETPKGAKRPARARAFTHLLRAWR
jgi:phosphatidylinositol-3-phosphatase